MLTPPVSDTSSPPPKEKTQDSDSVQAFFWNSKAQRRAHKDVVDHNLKNGPFKVQPPDPAKMRPRPFCSRRIKAEQKSSCNNSQPRVVHSGSKDDADVEGEKSPLSPITEGSASSTIPMFNESPMTPNCSTAPTSETASDCDVSDTGVLANDNEDNEGESLLRRMLTPAVCDTNSSPKKQDSEPVQVFVYSGNSKTKPNKSPVKSGSRIKLPPFIPDPPNPDKQEVGEFRATYKPRQPKKKQKDQKPCCDQNRRPNDSDNDADNERDTAPVSSNTRSAANRVAHAAPMTPTTHPRHRPNIRYHSKWRADTTAKVQDCDADSSEDSSTPSVSLPVKRKMWPDETSPSRHTTPISPLSDRPLKRLRNSPKGSPLRSPSCEECAGGQ